MNLRSLFRKKSLHQILEQVARGETEAEQHNLSRHLGVKDLTAFGIAAIIGAGVFSTIGNASADGGPAVIFLFLFTAIACGFCAFAYAEFASMVPVSGSAYTYSYVAFGEVVAWMIGWSLIMEYAIGNIAVAISWSDYFTGLLDMVRIPALGIKGLHIPEWLTMDYLSASRGFREVSALLDQGAALKTLTHSQQEAYLAYTQAPVLGGFHLVFDLPALCIITFITALVFRGIKESRNASNAMVVVKLSVVLLIIAVGIFYVDTTNWTPFAPNGVKGVLKGISAVFFAYIGFDAISTTAEECKDPQRDLPRGMMYAIVICTVLYILIALVLTGMVSYRELGVGDPLAFVFERLNMRWFSGIIAVSAVVAMASVLLVFQLGQPRIWMSMSRDGLLPKSFSRIHPRYKTPSVATAVTGFVVAVPSLFMNLTAVTDLCSIGTLFAFVLVCAGVLNLHGRTDLPPRKFKTPYINSRYWFPALAAAGLLIAVWGFPHHTSDFVRNRRLVEPEQALASYSATEKAGILFQLSQTEAVPADIMALPDPLLAFCKQHPAGYRTWLVSGQLGKLQAFETGWPVLKHRLPLWIFLLVTLVMAIRAYTRRLSLIPLLGMVCCLYMMSEMGISNWTGFGAWLAVGLVIYLAYGHRHSRLAKGRNEASV